MDGDILALIPPIVDKGHPMTFHSAHGRKRPDFRDSRRDDYLLWLDIRTFSVYWTDVTVLIIISQDLLFLEKKKVFSFKCFLEMFLRSQLTHKFFKGKVHVLIYFLPLPLFYWGSFHSFLINANHLHLHHIHFQIQHSLFHIRPFWVLLSHFCHVEVSLMRVYKPCLSKNVLIFPTFWKTNLLSGTDNYFSPELYSTVFSPSLLLQRVTLQSGAPF